MQKFIAKIKFSRHPLEHHYNINEALISLARMEISQFSRQGKLVNVLTYKRLSRYSARRLVLLYMGLS
jgi:hypothetical protein